MATQISFDTSNITAGVAQYQRKLIDIAQANNEWAFGCARELVGATNPTEVLRIMQNYMTKQAQSNQQLMKELFDAFQQKQEST
jgi:hypothetical protein